MKMIDKLEYCLNVGKENCRHYSLEAIVDITGLTGTKTSNDSEDDYFTEKFVEQYCAFEDSFSGYEYIPVMDGSGKYFKFYYDV